MQHRLVTHIWVQRTSLDGTRLECCACEAQWEESRSTDVCQEASRAWEASMRVTVSKGTAEPKETKIPAIKLLRIHIPEALGRGLRQCKDRVDPIFEGEAVTVPCDPDRVNDLVSELRYLGFGVVVEPREPFPLSPHARKVLDALEAKPDLWNEIQRYMSWRSR